MTSIKPYLLRGCYEWILDNRYTPYILVDAEAEGIRVPTQYVENGKIILNISPNATQHLLMNNKSVKFQASFGGLVQLIEIPISAVLAIYAKENNRGMTFDKNDNNQPTPPQPEDQPPRPPRGRPNLKLVK